MPPAEPERVAAPPLLHDHQGAVYRVPTVGPEPVSRPCSDAKYGLPASDRVSDSVEASDPSSTAAVGGRFRSFGDPSSEDVIQTVWWFQVPRCRTRGT